MQGRNLICKHIDHIVNHVTTIKGKRFTSSIQDILEFKLQERRNCDRKINTPKKQQSNNT